MKKIYSISSAALLTIIMLSSCGNSATEDTTTIAADTTTIAADTTTIAADTIPKKEIVSDGVTIGTQVWSTKNLDVAAFRNGDPIPQAKSAEEWKRAGENKQPAWCYYENNLANGNKYGKLYNWYAVNDPRGLAPQGWHIPSFDDWFVLGRYLDDIKQLEDGGWSNSISGKKLKAKKGWAEGSNIGTLPGGYRGESGDFDLIGFSGYWWTSETYRDRYESANNVSIKYDEDFLWTGYDYKCHGCSVRCIKD
jgi:uncharacterized protein (TIGR02145 family)